MDHYRLFMIGVVVLLLGVQFRLVESFELNEWASQAVEKRFPSQLSSDPTTSYVSQGPYGNPWLAPTSLPAPTTRQIAPPRKMSFLFISVGAILILVSPNYRK
jgi:hypothetical protein